MICFCIFVFFQVNSGESNNAVIPPPNDPGLKYGEMGKGVTLKVCKSLNFCIKSCYCLY